MKLKDDDIWLCADCLMAAVNDDYTGLDYYYKEPEATERMEKIKAGLERLGYISPHFDTESETCYYCPDCERYNSGESGLDVCPSCGEGGVEDTGNGYEEFSHRGCDCCDSTLAGSFWRFCSFEEE